MIWHWVIPQWCGRGAPNVDQFVGMRLRKLRTHRNVSTDTLAKLLKVPTSDIDRFEQGRKRISAARLFVLANYFGTTVAALFDRREALDELAS